MTDDPNYLDKVLKINISKTSHKVKSRELLVQFLHLLAKDRIKGWSMFQKKISDATLTNIIRKSSYIDSVTTFNGVPLFSWIDINITELCNRKCVFCPRVNPEFYPNLNLHMDVALAKKIGEELSFISYQGVVVFSGYSEPTLCPHFEEIIKAFPKDIRLELVTNGDKLTSKDFKHLFSIGINHFVVSLYDGEHQLKKFNTLFAKAGLSEEHYSLRDRWHDSDKNFGLKLTNRGGTIKIGEQPEVVLKKPCYYPSYSMTIDWNGDVLVCMQDWNKKVKFGNARSQSLLEIWQNKAFSKYRMSLLGGTRKFSPCNKCNAEGTMHGFNHADAWAYRQKHVTSSVPKINTKTNKINEPI